MITRRDGLMATSALGFATALSWPHGSALAQGTNAAQGWNNAQIQWLDHAAGVAEAQRTGKPILLIAHTTWCPHCTKYQKLFLDPVVVELTKSFVMVMLDRDHEKALNERLGPPGQTYVPRTLFLTKDGTLRADVRGSHPRYSQFVDYSSPNELLRMMKQAAPSG